MPFPNEHAARQTDPDQYKEFRRQHPSGFPAGIDAIFGIKTVEGKRVSEIQSLRANKEKWTVAEFRKWLEENDFKTTIEEASGDVAKDALCCDKLIEHLRTAKGFRQDGDRFVIEGVQRFDHIATIVYDQDPGEGEIKAVDTPEGFLRVEGSISRTGVQKYTDKDGNTWREYRPPDEVFAPETMDSFRLVVLTEGHPSEMVSVDNVKDVAVGHGGEPRREERIMATSFLITDADAIASAKDGSAVELSAGYTADVLLEGGVSPEGEEFDAIQTQIRGNHVAKVDKGRCGPECRLLTRGDAIQSINDNPNEDNMKITIEGKEVEIEEGSDLAKQLMALVSEGEGEGDVDNEGPVQGDPPTEPTGPDGEPKTVKVTTTKTIQNQADSALRAKIDSQEVQIKDLRDNQDRRIDERVELVDRARAIIGAEFSHKGKGDDEIMREVILAIQPELKDRLDANKGDRGYLRASYENALDIASERVDSTQDLNRTIHIAIKGGPKTATTELDNAYESHLDHLDHSRRAAKAEGEGK